MDRVPLSRDAFAYRKVMECHRLARSLRLDVGSTDHLCPRLGIFGDEITGICKRLLAQIDEQHLERRISNGGVNLLIEDCDDLIDQRRPDAAIVHRDQIDTCHHDAQYQCRMPEIKQHSYKCDNNSNGLDRIMQMATDGCRQLLPRCRLPKRWRRLRSG